LPWPPPHKVVTAIAKYGYDQYRIRTRLTESEQREMWALVQKTASGMGRKLTEADLEAWMRLGDKYYGGKMNAWRRFTWRANLYERAFWH
jgi:hypothetical protein